MVNFSPATNQELNFWIITSSPCRVTGPNGLLGSFWLLSGSSWPLQSRTAATFLSRRGRNGESGHLLYNAAADAGGTSVPKVCLKVCDCRKKNKKKRKLRSFNSRKIGVLIVWTHMYRHVRSNGPHIVMGRPEVNSQEVNVCCCRVN